MSSAGDAVQVVAGAGIDVYLGQTRFTKPNAVAVDGRELRFNKAVIATGSRPVAPTIEGLREGEYLTNETVFSLTELPRRLVVLGGGPMGSELAQAFRRLGSEVDLVHSRNNLLPKDEPEAGEVLRRLGSILTSQTNSAFLAPGSSPARHARPSMPPTSRGECPLCWSNADLSNSQRSLLPEADSISLLFINKRVPSWIPKLTSSRRS